MRVSRARFELALSDPKSDVTSITLTANLNSLAQSDSNGQSLVSETSVITITP